MSEDNKTSQTTTTTTTTSLTETAETLMQNASKFIEQLISSGLFTSIFGDLSKNIQTDGKDTKEIAAPSNTPSTITQAKSGNTIT